MALALVNGEWVDDGQPAPTGIPVPNSLPAGNLDINKLPPPAPPMSPGIAALPPGNVDLTKPPLPAIPSPASALQNPAARILDTFAGSTAGRAAGLTGQDMPAAAPPPPTGLQASAKQALDTFAQAKAQKGWTAPGATPIRFGGGKPKQLDYPGQLEQIAGDKGKAIAQTGQIEADQATAKANAMENADQQHADRLVSVDEKQKAFQADVDKRVAAHEAEVADLGNQKIDPKQYFGDLSVGGKIATIIGLGLGGFGSVRTGKNQASEILTGLIDRNIAGQTANLANKRAVVGEKGTLLQQFIARGDSLHDAQLKAGLAADDYAIREIATQAAKYNAPLALAKSQELVAAVQEHKAEQIADYRQKQAQLGIAGGHLKLAQQERQDKLDAAALARSDAQAAKGANAAQVPPTQVNLLKNPDGTPYQAADKELAVKGNDITSAATNTHQELDNYIGLINQFGQGRVWPSDAKDQLDRQRNKLIYTVKKEAAIRGMTEGAMEELGKSVPDATGIGSNFRDIVPTLEAYKEENIREANNELQSKVGYKGPRWTPAPLAPSSYQRGGHIGNETAVPAGETPIQRVLRLHKEQEKPYG